MDSSEGMIDEMNINFKHSKSIFRWINDKTITLMRDMSTLLTFLINILYVIDADRYDDFKKISFDDWAHYTSYVLAVF